MDVVVPARLHESWRHTGDRTASELSLDSVNPNEIRRLRS